MRDVENNFSFHKSFFEGILIDGRTNLAFDMWNQEANIPATLGSYFR